MLHIIFIFILTQKPQKIKKGSLCGLRLEFQYNIKITRT
jgi:hypothetical protein